VEIKTEETPFVCTCSTQIVALIGELEPGEMEVPGVGLQEFHCPNCGMLYSKHVLESRWGEVKKKADW